MPTHSLTLARLLFDENHVLVPVYAHVCLCPHPRMPMSVHAHVCVCVCRRLPAHVSVCYC